MTAKELCALVGITEANLSILRSGKASGVRFHTINRICYYLNCDVGDILRFDGFSPWPGAAWPSRRRRGRNRTSSSATI